jgi:hypothetical protein
MINLLQNPGPLIVALDLAAGHIKRSMCDPQYQKLRPYNWYKQRGLDKVGLNVIIIVILLTPSTRMIYAATC